MRYNLLDKGEYQKMENTVYYLVDLNKKHYLDIEKTISKTLAIEAFRERHTGEGAFFVLYDDVPNGKRTELGRYTF